MQFVAIVHTLILSACEPPDVEIPRHSSAVDVVDALRDAVSLCFSPADSARGRDGTQQHRSSVRAAHQAHPGIEMSPSSLGVAGAGHETARQPEEAHSAQRCRRRTGCCRWGGQGPSRATARAMTAKAVAASLLNIVRSIDPDAGCDAKAAKARRSSSGRRRLAGTAEDVFDVLDHRWAVGAHGVAGLGAVAPLESEGVDGHEREGQNHQSAHALLPDCQCPREGRTGCLSRRAPVEVQPTTARPPRGSSASRRASPAGRQRMDETR